MRGNLVPRTLFSKVGFVDFEQLVVTRRTVHNYLPEVVSDELVLEALRLSLWAPNHKLTFPWVYVWIGAQARDRLADLYVELKQANSPMSDVKARASRDAIMNPSHLIGLGIKLSDERRMHEDYATLACSVQIASMFLWQQGIASKWSTGVFTTHSRTYEILGVDPKTVRLEGALLIGKAQHLPAVAERPALSQVLRRIGES